MPSPSRLSHRVARLGFALSVSLALPAIGRADSTSLAPRGQATAATVAPADLVPGCDDRNPCTTDTLDTSTGTCRHDPLSCDDGNPCTQDFCQSAAPYGCHHVPVPDSTPCDDDEGCTLRDACAGGVCTPGETLEANALCDDGNPCTVSDACDPSAHCVGTPLGDGAACDDRNACTQDERCVTSVNGVVCDGTAPACSDGDLCTEDRCDPSTGQCLHPPVSCADGNECTTDVCDPATGLCRRDNIDGPCDDGRYCTVDDVCTGGNCVGRARECLQPTCGYAVCDYFDDYCIQRDGAGCPPSGQCYSWFCQNGTCHLFNDSGSPCVLPGYCGLAHCIRGGCQPALNLPCVDDGNACTDEVCPQGSCTHPPKPDGTPCADRCHTCQGGVCSDTPVNCDDDNPCTDDPCDPTLGCLHTPRNCLDTNPCTFDICDASDGCRHLPAPAGDQCDDGIACTIQDSCVANSGGGMVCAGTVPGCDDGNPCTTDAGVVEGDSCSCRHTPVDDPCCSEGTPVSCDDGNACTVDACDGTNGDCRHDLLVCDDANACTHDVCEPQTGCVSRADPRDGQACDDLNACTRNDVCADGACGGTVLGDGEACDDSNVCTAEDQCYSGRCVGYGLEGGMPCDDGNSCTADDQCLYPENGDPECHGAARAIGASCDDGDLCTVNDRCFAAGAEGGAPACQGTGRDCADDDACTQDACDSSTGLCAHPPRSCEDGNSCTLDSCSTQTGECVHEPQDGTPCSEAGDRCHVGSCQGGACTGIAPVSCDDGNQCTFDFCDPASGCVHGGSGTFNPPPEICNGVDDDCDGKVDERELAPACEVRPRTMRDGRGQDSFTVTCRWNPACAGSPVPAPLDDIRPGWLSAADGLEEAGDDVVLPNPIAHCDTAIVEDDGKRTTSNAAVTFVFDPDGNGVCGTTGGGRAGLMQHLADVPDGELARICVRWRLAGPERCGVVLVRHETFTEQRRERRSKGQ